MRGYLGDLGVGKDFLGYKKHYPFKNDKLNFFKRC